MKISDQGNSRQRNKIVEVGRLLASIAIVWVHAMGGIPEWEESTRLTRWAVPFFIAASLWYTSDVSKDSGALKFLWRRFLRLYPVFLFWNVVYFLVRFGASKALGHPFPIGGSKFLGAFFLDGFAHHLWFLNFVLFVHVGQAISLRLGLSHLHVAVGAVLGLAGLVVIEYLNVDLNAGRCGYLMDLSIWSLPAVFCLVALRPIFELVRPEATMRATVGCLFLLVGFLVVNLSLLGARNSVLEGLSGVILFFGALLVGESGLVKIPDLGLYLAGLSGGVYLVHVLFIEGFQDLLDKIAPSVSSGAAILIFFVAVLVSFVAAYFIQTCRLGFMVRGFSGSRGHKRRA